MVESSRAPRLVLVGGGHAHLEVLRRLGEDRAAGRAVPELTLVSLDDRHHYSGMVPGYLAGMYEEDDLAVPLAPLVERAGGRLVVARVTGVAPEDRRLRLAPVEGRPREGIHPPAPPNELDYDLVSFDVGSLAAGQKRDDVAEHALPVKPIGRAVEVRKRLVALARDERSPRAVVVGGGAAGVEVAFAAARALRSPAGEARIVLVEGMDRLLPEHPKRLRRRAAALLTRRGVRIVTGRRAAEVAARRVRLDDGTDLPSDLTLWLTGPAAPPLFEGSGLPLDARGFLLVDPALRSTAEPTVFGAGDCVTLAEHPRTPKAGVYAVREGPVLHASLRAAMDGSGELPRYEPQDGYLALLNSADGSAFLSWKGFAMRGRWAWWLKDAIDRRFLRKYRQGLE